MIFNFQVTSTNPAVRRGSGRTLAINPGSEYSEGVLRGAIITLSRKKGVRGYQLVQLVAG